MYATLGGGRGGWAATLRPDAGFGVVSLRLLAVLGAAGVVVVVQVVDLGLQDAHRPAERPGRVGQLPRPEKHQDHYGDDEYLPRAVKQIAKHVAS